MVNQREPVDILHGICFLSWLNMKLFLRCIFAMFNNASEVGKWRGNTYPKNLINEFRNAIMDCGLSNLWAIGVMLLGLKKETRKFILEKS